MYIFYLQNLNALLVCMWYILLYFQEQLNDLTSYKWISDTKFVCRSVCIILTSKFKRSIIFISFFSATRNMSFISTTLNSNKGYSRMVNEGGESSWDEDLSLVGGFSGFHYLASTMTNVICVDDKYQCS